MLLGAGRVPRVLLVAAVASGVLAAAFATPLPGRPAADRSTDDHAPEQPGQYVRAGNCSGGLELLYVETLVLAKDASSLIHGSIEVNLDSGGAPLAMACVRIRPQTEHDRLALAGHRFLGPRRFTLDVQEQPPQQARSMQYEIAIYRALPPRGQSVSRAHRPLSV